jgi:hypothetical protein
MDHKTTDNGTTAEKLKDRNSEIGKVESRKLDQTAEVSGRANSKLEIKNLRNARCWAVRHTV